MISAVISRLVILVFGTLYPAYASYKTVRTKNVKEYVKWMMYWIVFALFTTAEIFTDVFFSWLPFYYEIKIILVLWLLSPATKGSSILYRKFVHPTLISREQEIDEYISKAKKQGYKHFLDLGQKGVSVLMQTALKGGGGIVNHLRKSYSLTDLTETNHGSDDSGQDEMDVMITDSRLIRRKQNPGMTSNSIYFQEIDIRNNRVSHVQSVEDISSGYSSGEGLYVATGPDHLPKLVQREALIRRGSLSRAKTTRVTRSTVVPRKSLSDESNNESLIETNMNIVHQNMESDNKVQDSSEDDFADSLDNLHDCNLNTSEQSLTACNQEVENSTKVVESIKVPRNDDDDDDKIVKCERGGRYNKRVAPGPPVGGSSNSSAIKATLVLQPGVVRSIGNESFKCKEMFIQSSKSKRRTVINQTTSPFVTKLDSSLTKLLNLPKKIWHHKDDIALIKAKRFSWNGEREEQLLNLPESKVVSKSDNNLNKSLNGSYVSIRSMMESPLQRRRLKIIKRFIDEDID